MKYIEVLVLAIIAVFAPVEATLLASLALVTVDFITGVVAAYKRKEPITSAGFKRTVGKLFLYEIAICMAFLAEHYLTGTVVPACKMVSTMIGLVELKSILENVDSISGTNTFAALVDKLTQSEKR